MSQVATSAGARSTDPLDYSSFILRFIAGAKACALQHRIDRSGIANRPMPGKFNGPQLMVGGGISEQGTDLA